MKLLSAVEAAAKIGAAAAEIDGGMRELMTLAAERVQAEARKMIGHYQTDIQPFEDWRPLAASTVRKRVKEGYPPDEPLLREGIMREGIEITVGAFEASVGSNDPVALWQELGTERIPPRSFLGAAAVRCADEVAMLIGGGFISAMMAGGEFESMIRGQRIGPRPGTSTLPLAIAARILSAAGITSVIRGFMRSLLE